MVRRAPVRVAAGVAPAWGTQSGSRGSRGGAMRGAGGGGGLRAQTQLHDSSWRQTQYRLAQARTAPSPTPLHKQHARRLAQRPVLAPRLPGLADPSLALMTQACLSHPLAPPPTDPGAAQRSTTARHPAQQRNGAQRSTAISRQQAAGRPQSSAARGAAQHSTAPVVAASVVVAVILLMCLVVRPGEHQPPHTAQGQRSVGHGLPVKWGGGSGGQEQGAGAELEA